MITWLSHDLYIVITWLSRDLVGMVFCVNMGLANLTNNSAEEDRGKTYSLFIGDTVLVNEVSGVLITIYNFYQYHFN